MATAPSVTYRVASGAPVNAGRWPGGRVAGSFALGELALAGSMTSAAVLGPTTVAADGIWTWFTDPRAVYRNGATYFMAVSSTGVVSIYKYVHATGFTQSFALASLSEIDDHDNGSILFKPDGTIVAFYGGHNDLFRYRVSTASENISAWSAEAARGAGSFSYPNAFQFSQDTSKFYLFHREWIDGAGVTRDLSYRTTTTITASSDPWSVSTKVFENFAQRPYCKLSTDGIKRLHVLTTDGHPNETQTSLYHCYMELDGSNVPRWYRSNGVEITSAQPFNLAADATLIYNGSAAKCWVSDSTIGADGNPQALWMRYPNNNGTAIEYWHARWNGSAWVNTKIVDDGAGLYAGEQYYHGGVCFDAVNASTIYLSAPISGKRQIQRWTTVDSGATWAKAADITTGAGAGLRARPYSPRNHNGEVPVLWWDGTYTTYADYNTSIMRGG